MADEPTKPEAVAEMMKTLRSLNAGDGVEIPLHGKQTPGVNLRKISDITDRGDCLSITLETTYDDSDAGIEWIVLIAVQHPDTTSQVYFHAGGSDGTELVEVESVSLRDGVEIDGTVAVCQLQ